jgi:hypothetical protein
LAEGAGCPRFAYRVNVLAQDLDWEADLIEDGMKSVVDTPDIVTLG